MRRIPLILAVLFSFSGCGEDIEGTLEPEAVGSQSEPIAYGVIDYGHPAVGMVLSGTGCTGTLIGTRTVLTAAHCIQSNQASFVLGNKTYSGQPVVLPSWVSKTRDLAVVRLDQQVTGVEPMPVCDLRNEWLAGMYLVIVGYGYTSANGNDYGTKRMGVSRIQGVPSATSIVIGGNNAAHTCYGDSGGPALMQFLPPPPPPGNPPPPPKECVAGVSSVLWYPACQNQEAHTRPDYYSGWINSVAADSSIRWLDIPPARHYPIGL